MTSNKPSKHSTPSLSVKGGLPITYGQEPHVAGAWMSFPGATPGKGPSFSLVSTNYNAKPMNYIQYRDGNKTPGGAGTFGLSVDEDGSVTAQFCLDDEEIVTMPFEELRSIVAEHARAQSVYA